MHTISKSAILSLCVALAATLSAAPVRPEPPTFRFARIFTDNMVLQQARPIKVWGWAQPGAKVAVSLTQDAATGEKAVAAVLETQARSRTRRPAVREEDDGYSVTVRYVEKNPPKLTARTLETKAGAEGRWSVEFEPARAGFQPTWIIARSGEIVIAVHNVLIGEIWVCAGQSNMGWSNFNRKDREAASADFPALRYVAWDDSWYKPLDDVRKNISWQSCSPETAVKFSAVPYLYGMYLHRYLKVPVGIINVARGGTTGQTWCLREELDSIDSEIITTILKDYDTQTTTWEKTRNVEQIMADWEHACEQANVEHEKKVAQAKADGKKEPKLRLPKRPADPRSGWSPPAGLFNATIIPIRDLRIRGVLYYQGENNNFMRWTRYEYTFGKVVVSFRKAFADAELPFGCISQPGWGAFGMDPEVAAVAQGYAIIRDIQRRALAGDANAGMIATYPTGNSYIHPAEKLPVAEYASLWALANVYDKPVMHRGPTYREMKKKDGRLYLFFDVDPVVEGMINPDKEPPSWLVLPCARQGKAEFLGFIIAGEDRRWYPADAKHAKLDGKWCLEVWSDLVEDPVAVRYGWANWPTGNMVGRNRLPAPTFRTDDWPIPKGMSYDKQVREQCSEVLKQLTAEAGKQALDRKIRQIEMDLPILENELYLQKLGSEKQLIESKIKRMESVLDELEETDEWLSRRIKRNHPELVEKLKAAREAVEALKAQAAKIEEEK